jgi:hypothetical protein
LERSSPPRSWPRASCACEIVDADAPLGDYSKLALRDQLVSALGLDPSVAGVVKPGLAVLAPLLTSLIGISIPSP